MIKLVANNKVQTETHRNRMQTKPDWIMPEQWKAVPSVQWWKDVRAKKESIVRQKPVTPEEALEQFNRLRQERSWKEKGKN